MSARSEGSRALLFMMSGPETRTHTAKPFGQISFPRKTSGQRRSLFCYGIFQHGGRDETSTGIYLD